MKRFLLQSWFVFGLLGLLAVAASCARVAPVEPETLYGFELGEFEGIPATDIAVRIEPAIAKQELVQPASQLMADALRVCGNLAQQKGAMDTPRGLELTLHAQKLTRSAASQQKPSPLTDCLLVALDGKSFKAVSAVDHKVTIQLRRHFELP